MLRLYPKDHSVFYNEAQNFENCIQAAIRLQRNTEF